MLSACSKLIELYRGIVVDRVTIAGVAKEKGEQLVIELSIPREFREEGPSIQ